MSTGCPVDCVYVFNSQRVNPNLKNSLPWCKWGRLMLATLCHQLLHRTVIITSDLPAIFFGSPHFCLGPVLILAQTNIIVDASGCACVAGLRGAILPSAMPWVGIDKFFPGAAPKLVDPQRFGLTNTGATEDSDMYAFGVLTWKVSPM